MEDITKVRWYQEATIKGVKMPQRRKRDTSEKRWRELIEPLMPKSGGVFIELGSNAGFYLRKAIDLGYKATGVEISDQFVAQARYWEENEPKGAKTIQADLNDYLLPVAQVVLLANIIYWLTPQQRKNLIKKLKGQALNVIVIGRHQRLKAHKSDCRKESLKSSFRQWRLAGERSNEKHFSLLFHNQYLCERKIEDLKFCQQAMKEKWMIPAYRQLIKNDKTGYYKYFEFRGTREAEKERLMKKYLYFIQDMLANGIKKPIRIDKNNLIIDGDHRVIMAEYLGFKTVICRLHS